MDNMTRIVEVDVVTGKFLSVYVCKPSHLLPLDVAHTMAYSLWLQAYNEGVEKNFCVEGYNNPSYIHVEGKSTPYNPVRKWYAKAQVWTKYGGKQYRYFTNYQSLKKWIDGLYGYEYDTYIANDGKTVITHYVGYSVDAKVVYPSWEGI